MEVQSEKGGAVHLPFQGPHWTRKETEIGDDGLAPLRLILQPSGMVTQVTRAEVIVGRHTEADIRLPLPDVSRRHCRLVFSGGKWHIFDLESLNGVFVNGVRVRQADLVHRDQIRIGGYQLEVDLRTTSPTVVLPGSDEQRNDSALRSIAGAISAAGRKEAA
jgi:pSer/pThr/pTyr-binding forkhead associated (FHA) protein